MYRSPVFLSNLRPSGLPHICSFFMLSNGYGCGSHTLLHSKTVIEKILRTQPSHQCSKSNRVGKIPGYTYANCNEVGYSYFIS